MKISYRWLKEYLDFDLKPEEIADQLTMCGLEVEGMQTLGPASLEGLVVGLVLDVKPHPNADKLKITRVDVGKETPLQIICGASNVKAGQKVVVAPHNSVIYPVEGPPIKIKRSKIRGELSEGMICAEDEIGIGFSHEGIMVLETDAAPGTPFENIHTIQNDTVYEIGLTPNRVDAASHFGVCRDLYAVNYRKNWSLKLPQVNFSEASYSAPSVNVLEIDKCPLYFAVMVENVKINDTPEEIKRRLETTGIQSINAAVDIANYVMLECGQPLHLFDFDKIEGGLVIRNANDGEVFQSLDGRQVKLCRDDLVIADQKKALCLAGIIGGENSKITVHTQTILIESAWFHPSTIRRSSKKHDWHTEASFRFERGTDPGMVRYAALRCAQLLEKHCGGKMSGQTIIIQNEAFPPKNISIALKKIEEIAGCKIDPEVIVKILIRSGFEKVTIDNGILNVIAPYAKPDVTRPIDVIEEILRIYGYDRLQADENIRFSFYVPKENRKDKLFDRFASTLQGQGFFEVVNNSLIPSSIDSKEKLMLANPISNELDALRHSLIYGLASNVAYNFHRQTKNLKLYEKGKIYLPAEKGITEKNVFGLITLGQVFKENWFAPVKDAGYFYHQSLLHQLLELFAIKHFQIKRSDTTAQFFHNDQLIAQTMPVDNDLKKKLDIHVKDLWYSEIYVDQWPEPEKNIENVNEIPKFPYVRRDLSFVCDKDTPYETIENTLKKSAGPLCREMFCFDIYSGKNIPEGKISYALAFIFRHDQKTLTDAEVDQYMQQVMISIEHRLNGEIRK